MLVQHNSFGVFMQRKRAIRVDPGKKVTPTSKVVFMGVDPFVFWLVSSPRGETIPAGQREQVQGASECESQQFVYVISEKSVGERRAAEGEETV